ncbi:MAG: ribosome small subunit-dependent GTPase A [Candidatus Cloacimonetes bacterium HGW-Cloacimonetes-3]|jgi:ribosome biogenesis GTPase|nr:MAG: ribosome small subunit-dependent GTPase A [Candidatus Cloacimonetes bacterium HGW-Cloacimonetes-3]
MKQRDKKQVKRHTGRLRNISLPDIDILDDIKDQALYKTARTHDKSKISYKGKMSLVEGRITEIKSNYLYLVEVNGIMHASSMSGRLKQFLYKSQALAAVGDTVSLDMSAEPDSRIEHVLPRKNALIRYGDGSFQKEIVLAANIDQVIITSSWRMPIFKPGLIDRYLCIAAIQGINAIILINKIDLLEFPDELEEETAYYRQLGIPLICTSTVDGTGMEELKEELKDKDSVFTGHSGTGKSTLINYLEPGLNLATAEVSESNEKGKHTTTQAVLLPWSFGGHLLDTPGIKTISLHADHKVLIPKVFPGFDLYYPHCRFRDCSHTHEAECAVLQAVEDDKIPIDRYDSYISIYEGLS